MIDFFVPVKIVSELNRRDHWAVKMKRKQAQQQELSAVMHNAMMRKKVTFPCVVRLIRIGPKAMDGDNLQGGLKGVRDVVARKLGVDDGDTEKVKFEYHQKVVRERVYGVKVQII